MGQREPESSKNDRLTKLLGFTFKDLTSWENLTHLLQRPTDCSSLSVMRILFGGLMLIDIFGERGLGDADLRWGELDDCRFPLFNWLKPLPLPWMCMVYTVMLLGALGVMIGAYFRISCGLFTVTYWYLFLLDKSSWNNHSYLYGLLAILFLVSDAHHYWSYDWWVGRVKSDKAPLWNYGILRFQLFILYFIAGLKKTDLDWLEGYSMEKLSDHWVFSPMRPFFTHEQIDLWVVHVMGFLIDLTIGFWLFFDKTRPFALLIVICFHLMNAQMFCIGMFSYVCLAGVLIFCDFDWPKRLWDGRVGKEEKLTESSVRAQEKPVGKLKRNGVGAFLISYGLLQFFLPYSHFITKGYNNWTDGLYGYSWNMMVYNWGPSTIVIKLTDRVTYEEYYINQQMWVQSERWSRHADMVAQYSHCVKENVRKYYGLQNVSLSIDHWTSLNGRFQQRMYNYKVDLLDSEWSPFKKPTWVMPLLHDLTHWRPVLREIESEVQSWSNHSKVVFIADFPGFSFENYFHQELTNITLTVLDGKIVLELNSTLNSTLIKRQSLAIPSNTLYKIHTVSSFPSCLMLTFINNTKQSTTNEIALEQESIFEPLLRAIAFVSNSLLNILYSVPMVRRVRVLSNV